MQRIALFTLFGLESLFASDLSQIHISLGNIILIVTAVIIVALLFMLFLSNKKAKVLQEVIKEKDEKIQWLRKVFAQKETNLNKTIRELENNVNELNHTIDSLEQKLKEGTKNQVVAKLESLERKREEVLYKLKDK